MVSRPGILGCSFSRGCVLRPRLRQAPRPRRAPRPQEAPSKRSSRRFHPVVEHGKSGLLNDVGPIRSVTRQRRVRLVVRTQPSQGWCTGSTPVRAAKQMLILSVRELIVRNRQKGESAQVIVKRGTYEARLRMRRGCQLIQPNRSVRNGLIPSYEGKTSRNRTNRSGPGYQPTTPRTADKLDIC